MGAVERAGTELARRTSRRSFLGTLGRTVVAIAGGSMVAVALEPDRAEAHHICGHRTRPAPAPTHSRRSRGRTPTGSGAPAARLPGRRRGRDLSVGTADAAEGLPDRGPRAVPVRAEPAVRRRLEPLLQRTRSAYPGLLFGRRHADQRRRCGARLLPAARKVFCITYRSSTSGAERAGRSRARRGVGRRGDLEPVRPLRPVDGGDHHPRGPRGSRSRWGISLALHAVGAAVAAAIVGSLLAGAGALLGAPWGVPGVVLVAAAAALYVARELGLPCRCRSCGGRCRTGGARSSPARRGVPLRARPRPGFLTYLGHGTVVVVSVAAFASGRPLLGAAVLAPFGLARGLGPVLAFGVRSPSDAAALVERLDRSASKARWRVANALALSMMLVAAVVEVRRIDGPSEVGALAAAGVALTFGAAAVAKLARRAGWRTLGSYGLRPGATGLAGFGVPAAELGIAALALAGLGSSAGLLSIVALVIFSGAIVLGRVRAGRRLERVLRWVGHPGLPAAARSQRRPRRGGVRRVEGGGGRADRALARRARRRRPVPRRPRRPRSRARGVGRDGCVRGPPKEWG